MKAGNFSASYELLKIDYALWSYLLEKCLMRIPRCKQLVETPYSDMEYTYEVLFAVSLYLFYFFQAFLLKILKNYTFYIKIRCFKYCVMRCHSDLQITLYFQDVFSLKVLNMSLG